MKVTTESTLGNFLAQISVEADEQLQRVLLPLGLKYVLQRQTSIDKTLGGFTVDANGKRKRKAGWKRTDEDFGAEMAQNLEGALASLAMPDDTTLKVLAAVSEYVRDEKTPKYAEARLIVGNHESKGDLETWAKTKIGFSGPTHTEDGEDFNPDLLLAVKEFIKDI